MFPRKDEDFSMYRNAQGVEQRKINFVNSKKDLKVEIKE